MPISHSRGESRDLVSRGAGKRRMGLVQCEDASEDESTRPGRLRVGKVGHSVGQMMPQYTQE